VAHLESNRQSRVALAAPITKAEILKYFEHQVEQLQEVQWDAVAERISARQIIKLGALILEESPLLKPDPELVADVLLKALQEKGIERLPWSAEAKLTRQRMNFLHALQPDQWPDLSDKTLTTTMDNWLRPHLMGLKTMEQVSRLDFNQILLAGITWEQRKQMDQLAPTHLEVPSGSRIALDYRNSEAPVLAVRLQEIFGLLHTPRIAGGKVPLLVHLLSPASRPVQVTRDLQSFWQTGYFEVRKDLRGRYPKHYWPDDPLTATPTRSIKKKM
jgi:ATP-dependent helicase HrpB